MESASFLILLTRKGVAYHQRQALRQMPPVSCLPTDLKGFFSPMQELLSTATSFRSIFRCKSRSTTMTHTAKFQLPRYINFHEMSSISRSLMLWRLHHRNQPPPEVFWYPSSFRYYHHAWVFSGRIRNSIECGILVTKPNAVILFTYRAYLPTGPMSCREIRNLGNLKEPRFFNFFGSAGVLIRNIEYTPHRNLFIKLI